MELCRRNPFGQISYKVVYGLCLPNHFCGMVFPHGERNQACLFEREFFDHGPMHGWEILNEDQYHLWWIFDRSRVRWNVVFCRHLLCCLVQIFWDVFLFRHQKISLPMVSGQKIFFLCYHAMRTMMMNGHQNGPRCYAWPSGSFCSVFSPLCSTFSPIEFTSATNSFGVGSSAISLIPKYSINFTVVPYNMGRPIVSALPVISISPLSKSFCTA